MLKLVRPSTGEHSLTVTYNGKTNTFRARLIHIEKQVETWQLWGASTMATVTFNLRTKEVTQESDEKKLPEGFMRAVRFAFDKR